MISSSGPPGIESGEAVVATTRHKVPLLLTNRGIWLEASPFFYRLHLFNIRLLNIYQFPLPLYHDISAGVRNVLQAIRRIELRYRIPGVDSAEDATASTYLRLLRICCYGLKLLRVELSQDSCLNTTVNRSACELQQLWPRLDSLQVCVQHSEDLDAMPQGEFIAPGAQWRLVFCEELWVYAGGRGRWKTMRSLYCAERHEKAVEVD